MADIKIFLTLTSLLSMVLLAHAAKGCNEHICASIVSKCLLTESCRCDLETCFCCKDCFNCLSYLFSECCSCVDMCPKINETTTSSLSSKSHVEELPGVPVLFEALTIDTGEDEKWTTISFPVEFDTALYSAKFKDFHLVLHSTDQQLKATIRERQHIITYNCTVVFMHTCLSWNKCKTTCDSMGAASYRWFHDGCCECVGSKCINYGINESRCVSCPQTDEDEAEDMEDGDELDYGDLIGPLDTNEWI